MAELSTPDNPPAFTPPSGATVNVSIIDTTTKLTNIPWSFLTKPAIKGHDHSKELPALSFLIEHPTGRRVLFDLGTRKDFMQIDAPISARVKKLGWQPSAEKNVIEILEENNIPGQSIEALIWSHWHWDHVGDPSTFPSSTKLVVGQGFKKAFVPAWPTNPESHILEDNWKDRELVEIRFDEGDNRLTIGNFPAVDYFGDGSLYLLDSPGHAIGHLCGLARTTTSPDTFILMGGDACHYPGQFRPSKYRTIPGSIEPHPFTGSLSIPCPGDMFEALQTSRGRRRDQAFYDQAIAEDLNIAAQTICKVQEADVKENIWVVIAHDQAVQRSIDLFPAKANAWKEKGWDKKTRWAFLKDFQSAVQVEQ